MREALVPASVRGPAGAGREQQGGGGGRKRCAKSSEGERVSEREPRGASRLRWAGWVGGRPPAASGPPQQCARFWWPRPPSAAERAAPVSWVPRSRGLVPASRSRSPLARPSLPPRRREPFPARRRRSVGRPWRAGQPRPAGAAAAAAAPRVPPSGSRGCVWAREKEKRGSERERERARRARRRKLRSGRRSFPGRSGGGRRGRRGRALAVGALPRREAPCRRRAVPRGAATWLILPVAYACLKD